VTLRHDKFLMIKPTRCTNFSNLFWNETLRVLDTSSIIRSFLLYAQQWYTSNRFADSLQGGSGCSILILLVRCLQTCMTYTIAVCTVKNTWWWTEELSETCRVSFQNKFEKLVHLVGFVVRKIVKYVYCSFSVLYKPWYWSTWAATCSAINGILLYKKHTRIRV
jgi:hypothetical protein